MNASNQSVMQLISTDGIYGAERVVLDLAGYFSRRSWNSRVVAIDCSGADALLDLARHKGLGTHKLRAANRSLWHTLRDLRNYVVNEKISVVHAHGYKADTLLNWSGAARHARIISTCHTWYSDSWRMKFYEFLDKRSLRGFNRVAVVSPQLKEEVLACGVNPQRVALIRNGTAEPVATAGARERIRSEFSYGPEDVVLVRVGRLANSKGNDVLLRSLAGNPQLQAAKILFVGEGEERAALQGFADANRLQSRISFTGYRADIPDLLAAGDVFVLPSIKEGLPIALLEAMAASLPIVSTNAGAITMALENARNAWVVPTGDERSLAEALAQALSRPDLRAEYARRAREDFLRYFSVDAMGTAYTSLYEGAP
jgi:glycosyltransferase involved in cell wall biosynthesis